MDRSACLGGFAEPVRFDDIAVYRVIHKPEGWGVSIATYLLTDGKAWSIVDCGWSTPQGIAIWDTLRCNLGLRWECLDRILVTHSHPDHIGLAHDLSLRSGRPVSIHADALAELQFNQSGRTGDSIAGFLVLAGLRRADCQDPPPNAFASYSRLILPSHVEELNAGDVVSVGRIALEVLHTPGHGQGHVCLIDSRRRFAFLGDMVLPDVIPSVTCMPGTSDNPMSEYLASLATLNQTGVEMVFPAHGEPVLDPRGCIEKIRNYHAERLAGLRLTLSKGSATAAEIAGMQTFHGRRFQDLSSAAQVVVIGEVMAYLKHLEADGAVRSNLEPEHGHLVFSLKWRVSGS